MNMDAASNKRAALEQLKFNKQQFANRAAHANSSSNGFSNATNVSYGQSQPQPREATTQSRFFPVTPSSGGRVLVPSSSPLASDDPQRTQLPLYPVFRHDVAPPVNALFDDTWAPPSRTQVGDPLTASTNFMTMNHPSLRRPWNADDTEQNAEGPPRKKLNMGSHNAAMIPPSPTSPEVQIVVKRRAPPAATDLFSTSDDEVLPEFHQTLSTGHSKPRLVKARPPSTPASPDPAHDPRFIRFRVTSPMVPPAHCLSAWQQANGDEKRAAEFLSDPSWSPSALTIPKVQRTAEDTGRVRELDEANKALKMATKEKGKKSMIYANRTALESNQPRVFSTPQPSKTTVEVLDSPSTPIVTIPRRNRLRKVVDSDSEVEFVSAEETEEHTAYNGEEQTSEVRALAYFNQSNSESLQELTGCSPEQAEAIINIRPFHSVDDLNIKLNQRRKKAGPAGISPRIFEECTNIFEGYGAVDTILDDCERIGASIRAAVVSWSTNASKKAEESAEAEIPLQECDDGSLSLHTLRAGAKGIQDFLVNQPLSLSPQVRLKEYQLLGVNWLSLLYRRKLSCILADEMGLGKTVQVISFLAHLLEKGNQGPHLIIVPSSTLENWCREFARFAPSISVQTYYAGKEERPLLRQTLLDTQLSRGANEQGWHVLITTYNLAQGDDRDRKFFRKIDWDACIYDEGHILKNFQSQRYKALLKYGSRWRLLLTGTPLQNNLQELVSLMNFILPNQFAESMDSLRAIFKVKGDSKVTLLSQERISRAKKMMTPFVLRRRKDQVLKDLPNKSERIEWCEMTPLQQSIYTDALHRSRKIACQVESEATALPTTNSKKAKKPPRGKPKGPTYEENSANVLMDLRKAASHPMLFRSRFTDDILSSIAKLLLKEPGFKKRGALYELVKEDMSVMTDAELQVFCATYKSTKKFLQNNDCYLDAGKIKVLLNLLNEFMKEGRKILVFSQFTQILDILQALFRHRDIKHLVLTGSTPVDVRQSLVDEFTEDETISVFLLSTKAGGMGINLTAASVVIMFDQDFNPHNDRQAQDRAYRIGQKRDVEVVKLISRGTIEEDMLRLGQTKLALDEAVAGDGEESGEGESAPEREMKISLMNVLRQQYKKEQEVGT